MDTRITAFNLDSFGHAVDLVVRQSRSRALPRRRMRVRLQKLSALIGAIAITPVIPVAAGTRSRTEAGHLP